MTALALVATASLISEICSGDIDGLATGDSGDVAVLARSLLEEPLRHGEERVGLVGVDVPDDRLARCRRMGLHRTRVSVDCTQRSTSRSRGLSLLTAATWNLRIYGPFHAPRRQPSDDQFSATPDLCGTARPVVGDATRSATRAPGESPSLFGYDAVVKITAEWNAVKLEGATTR